MEDGRAADVLIVSLGSTAGLRRADRDLEDSLRRAGARVVTAGATAPSELPTLALTDLAWSRAARRAAAGALEQLVHPPRSIIYSSTTAALMWPSPGAIRFDAPAAANRPGRHGIWQRPLERRRLGEAPLLLPWSAGALGEAPASAREGDRAIVLPVAVEPSGPGSTKDLAAVTYAANPRKKGLDRVLAAWREVHSQGGAGETDELMIVGTSPEELARAGIELGDGQGVRLLGPLSGEEYRALVRRARVFVCAPRREDYGIAQLEALADGCLLVSTPAPGPYAALPIARTLDPRLVSEDLAGALRAALEQPLPDYQARAGDALEAFSRASVDRAVAEELLPRLLAEAPQL